MKKPIIFITLILILSLTLTLIGCSSKPTNENPEEVKTPNIEKEVPQADDPIKVEEENDKEFVNPFANNNNKIDYSYEVEVITNGQSDFTKFWVSGNKSRMELMPSETQDNVITILDGDEKVSYIYQPEDNTLIIKDYEPVSHDYDENDNYIDYMKSLFDDVKVENGTFEGQPVQILSGNISGNKNIIWISTKTRFPVKSEYYKDGKVVYTSLTKNFNISPVDQSLFKVPEGAEVID